MSRERYELPVPGFLSDELEPRDTTMAERRLARSSTIKDWLQVAAVVIPLLALVAVLVFGLPIYRAQAERARSALEVVNFQAQTEARFLRYLQARDRATSPEAKAAALEAFETEQATAEAGAIDEGLPVPTIVPRRPTRPRPSSSTTRPAPPPASPTTSRPPPTTRPCTVTVPTAGCVMP